MTVLSIGHLGPRSDLRLVIDKLLAVNALIFLASALMSFMSMHPRFSNWCSETSAEWTFILGLGILALCAFILAFSIN